MNYRGNQFDRFIRKRGGCDRGGKRNCRQKKEYSHDRARAPYERTAKERGLFAVLKQAGTVGKKKKRVKLCNTTRFLGGRRQQMKKDEKKKTHGNRGETL